MYSNRQFTVLKIILFFSLFCFSFVSLATDNHYASGTLITSQGKSYFSDKVVMHEDGKFRFLTEQGIRSKISIKELARVIFSKIDGSICYANALIELRDGRKFNVKFKTDSLFDSTSPNLYVLDPVNREQTRIAISCTHLSIVDFSSGNSGRYRQSNDGRIYPGYFVYDPLNGNKLDFME